jgi:hypothetical protein
MSRGWKVALVTASFVAMTFMGLGTAAAQYGEAGCGLGSMLITDSGFMQIFAATTNGTSASQTFGITSGTSNCVESGVVKVDKEQEAFVEANFESLQQDIAAGGGPHLDALVELMGCEGVSDAVNTVAQSRYETLFSSENTTPFAALYGLKGEMSMNQDIVLACTRL